MIFIFNPYQVELLLGRSNTKHEVRRPCGTCEKKINANRGLMDNPQRCGPRGRPRRISEDDVEMDLKGNTERLWTELFWYG
jgi:hypothetical protein